MEDNSLKKTKSVFVSGPISPEFIATSIAKHQSKTTIGAHQIFLGQVRNDIIDSQKVVAIEYSAFEEMAEKELSRIREKTFENFNIECMHIYHSLGRVNAGEICLFVFVSSAHRNACTEAINYVVEAIKSEVPVYGKEIFTDETYVWKENK